MSTQIRKYELRARADSQRETRDRIARAAAQLHEEVGPARTTVVEIARRAGVSRLTVYNHFADLEAMLPACTAYYETVHPTPDFEPALRAIDPDKRVEGVLALLYGWYRETAPLWTKVLSDRTALPELDRFLSTGIDRMRSELAATLADGLPAGRRSSARQALLAVSLDFWTWTRLDDEGLDDAEAARLMTDVVVGVAQIRPPQRD